MARPRREQDRVSTTLRLDRGLLDKIQAAADARDVGRNWLLSRLIEEGFDRLVPVEELTLLRSTPRVYIDPDMPPGAAQMVSGDQVVTIINLATDEGEAPDPSVY